MVQWSRIRPPMQEMQEIWVGSLDQEDRLEEERQPTAVFLPGEFHGLRSLVGYSPWTCKDMTEQLNITHDTRTSLQVQWLRL